MGLLNFLKGRTSLLRLDFNIYNDESVGELFEADCEVINTKKLDNDDFVFLEK